MAPVSSPDPSPGHQHQGASINITAAPAPKLPACDRCKARKIKCDAGLPHCKPCGRARVDCIGRDHLPSVPRGLVFELQQRVQMLEAQLKVQTETSRPPVPEERYASGSARSQRPQRSDNSELRNSSSRQSHPTSPSSSPSPKRIRRDATSNNDDNAEEGFSALSPTNIIAADALPYDRELSVELKGLAELRKTAAAHMSQMSPSQRSHLPAYDPALVDRLVIRYARFLNDALPVFEETNVVELVEKMRSNMPLHPSEQCQAHLVIALAFATLARVQHRSSELARAGQAHWKAAQVFVPASMRGTDLAKLQIILLQLQFVLLFPENGNAWELSGTSLRLAAALSLNREGTSDSPSSSALGRKLFWTAYCLDVSLAVALARPTAMSDSWISTKPPSLSLTELESPSSPRLHFSFVNHVALRRLQSEIYHFCYAYDEANDSDRLSESSVTEWLQARLHKLEKWRKEYRWATPFVTAQWTELNYHITKTLMFRPSPRIPRPGISALFSALDSSAQTIRLYKLNWRTFRVNFPWLANHHVFMAGLTYLNSLKSLHMLSVPTHVSLVDITMHVQSCASLLEVLSIAQDDTSNEQGSSNKVRDVFDTAAYAVLNSLFSTIPSVQPKMEHDAARARVAVAMQAQPSYNADNDASPLSLLASSAALAEMPTSARQVGPLSLALYSLPSAVVMQTSATAPQLAELPPSTIASWGPNGVASAEIDFSFLDWFLNPIDGGEVSWQDDAFGAEDTLGAGDLTSAGSSIRPDLWS